MIMNGRINMNKGGAKRDSKSNGHPLSCILLVCCTDLGDNRSSI